MLEIIKWKALRPCAGLFSVLRNQSISGPEMAAISRSATVRFIIRYVLRLRSWRVLTKIMRVKALIINIRRNSVSHTANQMFFVAFVDIVEFNLLQLLLLFYFLAFWIGSGEIKENGVKYETNYNNINNNSYTATTEKQTFQGIYPLETKDMLVLDTLQRKSQSSEPTKNDNFTANAFPN